MRNYRFLSMGRVSLLVLLLGAWEAGTASLWAQPEAPASRQPQVAKCYVKQKYFNLPLNMSPQTRANISEIQLWCLNSANGKWSRLTKCPPTQAGFDFDSRGEGEFWFTLTLVDLLKRSVPEKAEQSEYKMVVVVDMTPPMVDAQFVGRTNEGYLVQTDVRDKHPDPRKTVLEYQTLSKEWRAVMSVAPENNRFCIPKEAALSGVVRVTGADLAENVTSKEFELPLLRAAAHEVRAANPGEGPAEPSVIALPPQMGGGVSPSPFAAQNQNPPSQVAGTNRGAGAGVSSRTDNLRPCVSVIMEDVSDRVGPNGTVMPPIGPGKINLSPPKGTDVAPPPPAPADGDSVMQRLNPTTKAEVVNQDVRTAAASNIWASKPVVTTTSSSSPAPANSPSIPRRLINQRQVKLDYRLERVGASGVGRVEIWATSDQGQSWQKLCEDSERKSPVTVELPAEGVYGVTIAVSNGRGFGGSPPNPGDAPDTWVEVDMTRPVVEVKELRSGGAEDPGTLHMSWNVRDKNLAADGVDLYYASHRDGSWFPIAKGLRSDYHYRWAPPASVGSHVFLRLVAHDQAGNVTVVETSQAFAVDDMSRPRGRLIGIVPVSGEAPLESIER